MIAIIDYDAGNIKSVEKALLHLGEEVMITRDREKILNSDKVILPGVGAFGDAMEKLRSYGLDKVIYEVVEKKIPFLGICLGLQLLFEKSDETPGEFQIRKDLRFRIWDGTLSKSKKEQGFLKIFQKILMCILYIPTI